MAFPQVVRSFFPELDGHPAVLIVIPFNIPLDGQVMNGGIRGCDIFRKSSVLRNGRTRVSGDKEKYQNKAEPPPFFESDHFRWFHRCKSFLLPDANIRIKVYQCTQKDPFVKRKKDHLSMQTCKVGKTLQVDPARIHASTDYIKKFVFTLCNRRIFYSACKIYRDQD